MKKFKTIVTASLLSLFVTACGNTDEVAEEPVPDTSLEINQSDLDEVPEPTEENDNESEYIFTLTEEEQIVYEQLKEELSTSVLEDIDPFSIAKIHIQAGIDGEWEAEYAMFSEEGRERTLEEWGKFYEEEISEADQAYIVSLANSSFSLIDEGTFIDVSETEAYILFEDIYNEELVFRFVKNDAGIWEVRYHPIDFYN